MYKFYIKKYVEESSKQLQFYRHAPPCPVLAHYDIRLVTRALSCFLALEGEPWL